MANNVSTPTPQDTDAFNLMFLGDLLVSYWKFIVGFVGIACILAVIFTMPFFYPPEFKSSTIIYPTNPERFDLDNVFAEDPTVYVFGDSKGVEKLDNVANSEELKLFVMDSLNLWEAYGIDKDSGGSPKYYGLRTYSGNVSTLRVAGNGLEITAFDRDPQRAADIVNLVVARVDFTVRRMLQQNKEEVLMAYREGENRLSEQLNFVADSIFSLRKAYDVYHIERQTEAMISELIARQNELAEVQAMEGYYQNRNTSRYREAQAQAFGLENQLNSFLGTAEGGIVTLDKFRRGYDKVRQMEMLQDELAMELKNVQKKIINLERMKEIPYHTILITERAFPSDRKSRPVRWVLLVAVAFVSTLIAVLGIVLVDRVIPLENPQKDGKA